MYCFGIIHHKSDTNYRLNRPLFPTRLAIYERCLCDFSLIQYYSTYKIYSAWFQVLGFMHAPTWEVEDQVVVSVGREVVDWAVEGVDLEGEG